MTESEAPRSGRGRKWLSRLAGRPRPLHRPLLWPEEISASSARNRNQIKLGGGVWCLERSKLGVAGCWVLGTGCCSSCCVCVRTEEERIVYFAIWTAASCRTRTFIIRRGVCGVVSIIRGVLRHQANKQAAHKQRTVKITSMEAIMARAPFYEPRNWDLTTNLKMPLLTCETEWRYSAGPGPVQSVGRSVGLSAFWLLRSFGWSDGRSIKKYL